jgi:signal transduction histidine kinase
VIALGRLLMAVLFLIAVSLELGNPAEAPPATAILAVAYLFFAAAILLATWNSWWADARLAGAAHTLDIAMFTLMVLFTHGYTSPFFTFFMFLLLSAAIRWGWKATALTAVLVTLLYLIVGLVDVRATADFDLQRFLVRTGHLVILSLILIWFGINQWRSRFSLTDRELLANPSLDFSPVEASLRAAMTAVRASRGAFAWWEQGSDTKTATTLRDAELGVVALDQTPIADATMEGSFLYDLAKDRALTREPQRGLRAFEARNAIDAGAADALALTEGLSIPVRTETGSGALFLQGIPALSTDDLDLGDQIAADVAANMQRHALVRAAEDNAAARSRLSLARDLHDSVVQFLAGAAFRLEAMRRGQGSGADVGPEIDELKKLMLEEQSELRAFLAALRSGSQIALDELAKDLRGLAERLSKQWSVNCAFSSEPANVMIPTRLHLDAQQLVREAVANAVRHAGAKSISIRLAADADDMQLVFINDGAAYPKSEDGGRMPKSLRERVEEAGGALDLSRGMGVTRLTIELPLAGDRQ